MLVGWSVKYYTTARWGGGHAGDCATASATALPKLKCLDRSRQRIDHGLDQGINRREEVDGSPDAPLPIEGPLVPQPTTIVLYAADLLAVEVRDGVLDAAAAGGVDAVALDAGVEVALLVGHGGVDGDSGSLAGLGDAVGGQDGFAALPEAEEEVAEGGAGEPGAGGEGGDEEEGADDGVGDEGVEGEVFGREGDDEGNRGEGGG